ncbi:MAG: type IV pilin N-terminal domain-containing protein [Archaeoglobaceae archaeon]|nr:type IV pilin N-terminal domain-containing protein [Archaeoglobaceae archaeon]MDW8118091.1 type IV pilin N-terminal domain-containing protein [Archaeoglobaceae archaeon]
MRRDEKGVSPVIGTILMVAITVILAAVIASFVFGLGGTVKRTYTLSFQTTAIDQTNVKLLYGGGDGAYVRSCKAIVDDDPVTITNAAVCEDGLSVGEVLTIQHGKPGEAFDFVLVTTMADGSEQIAFTARLIAPSGT